MKCSGCEIEFNALSESFQAIDGGGYHIRGVCPACGKWIKWIPYKDSVLVGKAIEEYVKNNGGL